MTNKDIYNKFDIMAQTYIDLIVYSKAVDNWELVTEYEHKLQAVRSTLHCILGAKYLDKLDDQQENMYADAKANQ